MDSKRFDLLTKSVVGATSRRHAIRGLAAGLVAGVTSRLGMEPAAAQQNCVNLGKSCKRRKGERRPKCCGNTVCRQNRCECKGSRKRCGTECITENQCCHNKDCPSGQKCRNNRCAGTQTCEENEECPSGACSCTQAGRPEIPGTGECQKNSFVQNFNNNANGWFAFLNPDDDTQKTWDPPATDGTITLQGNRALIKAIDDNKTEKTAASPLGGFSTVFPDGGFDVSLDIFLDPADVSGPDPLKFAYSVAINQAGVCAYADEFMFHGGGSNGTGYCVNAGGGSGTDPCGENSVPIGNAGLFTFVHEFRESTGNLDVTLRLLKGNQEQASWNFPEGPIVDFGGNRYAWFPVNDFDGLQIDNSRRTNG